MMPIAWFYVVLVCVLWCLLLYVEVRRRERRKVRGCFRLVPISADKLWSMIVMYPQLEIIELEPLKPSLDSAGPTDSTNHQSTLIEGAVRVPVSGLTSFLRMPKRLHSFVFYAAHPGEVDWEQVDDAVYRAGIRKGYVLKGDAQSWLTSQLMLHARPQAPRQMAAH